MPITLGNTNITSSTGDLQLGVGLRSMPWPSTDVTEQFFILGRANITCHVNGEFKSFRSTGAIGASNVKVLFVTGSGGGTPTATIIDNHSEGSSIASSFRIVTITVGGVLFYALRRTNNSTFVISGVPVFIGNRDTVTDTLSFLQSVSPDANTTPSLVSSAPFVFNKENFNVPGNLRFNSGFGSVATAYGCRAWVNFDGTLSSNNMRGSGNVSSVTRNGTGAYTVAFGVAMPDATYAVCTRAKGTSNAVEGGFGNTNYATTSVQLQTFSSTGTGSVNPPFVNMAIFR